MRLGNALDLLGIGQAQYLPGLELVDVAVDEGVRIQGLDRQHGLLHRAALARTLGKEKELEVLEPPVSSEGLYLALSHKSGCNQPALREQLARKMRELVAGPLPEQLVAENLERWQRQQAGK